MSRPTLDPGQALLVDRGSPVVYEALGAFLVLERLEEADAARLEKVNRLVLDWIGEALTLTSTTFWPLTDPFRPADLDYISSFATHLSPPSPGTPNERFESRWDALSRADFGVNCHGGEEGEGSPFTYRATGAILEANEAMPLAPILVLRVSVPASWPLDDFRSRVEAIVDNVRLRWGAAGLVFAGSEDAFHNQYWAAVYKHARRHPGVDIEAHVPYMRETYEKIRSVSWLTFLGRDLAGHLLSDVQTRLVKVHRRSGTVELQAGDAPARGDINRLDVPRAYVEADELVRSIRLNDEVRFMDPFDDRSTTEWLRRFERRVERR